MSVTITIDDSDYQIMIGKVRPALERMPVQVIEEMVQYGEDRLRQNVPVKTGRLRDSVGSYFQGAHGAIFTSSGYGKFVDEDTKEHEIRGNPFLRFELEGLLIFARKVLHPGTIGQRFKERTIGDIVDRSTDIVISVWNRLVGR